MEHTALVYFEKALQCSWMGQSKWKYVFQLRSPVLYQSQAILFGSSKMAGSMEWQIQMESVLYQMKFAIEISPSF